MAHVYVLSEDDFDDQVYVYVLEALLSVRVEPVPIRLRRGGGIGEVRKKLPLLLSAIRRSGPVDETYFVVGIDNDRASQHAAHLGGAPRERDCRYCGLEEAIAQGMPDGRPIPGAVAVPVEMIESWLLLMFDPSRYTSESALPRCARRDQEVARRIYGANPSPQLKDLVDVEMRALGSLTKPDFALACVLRLDATLATRSPSFAQFRDQLTAWRAKA